MQWYYYNLLESNFTRLPRWKVGNFTRAHFPLFRLLAQVDTQLVSFGLTRKLCLNKPTDINLIQFNKISSQSSGFNKWTLTFVIIAISRLRRSMETFISRSADKTQLVSVFGQFAVTFNQFYVRVDGINLFTGHLCFA